MAKDKEDNSTVSDESKEFLEQAKKGKPRKFAMICKGTNVVSLVVFKKGSYEKRKKEAKESGKGQFYFGVIDGKGMDLRFTLARADGFDSAPVKSVVLKGFLEESADFKCKPTFEIVDQLEVVLDEDNPLVQRFQSLKPVAKSLAASNARLAPEVNQLCETIAKHLELEESEQASTQLTQLETLLKDNAPSGNEAAAAAPASGPAEAMPPENDSVPPPPPPPPPPPSSVPSREDVLKGKLAEALKKLKPLLEQALQLQPARKAELVGAVGSARDSLEKNQLSQAQTTIVDLGTLLKSIVSGGSSAPSSEKPQSDPASDFAERQRLLVERVAAAAAKVPDKAAALQKVLDFADQQAKKGDYAAANKGLDKLQQALEGIELAAEQSSGPLPAQVQFDDDTQYVRMFLSIEARYLHVLRQNPDNAGKLRAVMDFANGKAEASDFKSGVTALQKLEELLNETETNLLNQAVDVLVDEIDEQRGVVAQRKALLVWDSLRGAALSQVQALQTKVATQYPAANVERLEDVFSEIDESLHEALIDCINAADEVDRAHYNQVAIGVIERLRKVIDQSVVIEGIDRNPFLKTSLKGDLHKALKNVATLLEKA